MDGARAQRTGRAHLRVPVDEMIFEIAKRPTGQIQWRHGTFGYFCCCLGKVTRRARDWLRKTAWMPSQNDQSQSIQQTST